MGREQKTLQKLTKIVDDFNKRYPVGSQVVLRKDTGLLVTFVRAPAEVLGGHSAVAWFEGVRGCYSIEDDRVKGALEACTGSGVSS